MRGRTEMLIKCYSGGKDPLHGGVSLTEQQGHYKQLIIGLACVARLLDCLLLAQL